MQNRSWVTVVGWLTALGIPMTPLAGTFIGYGLLACAGCISVWQGWKWINQQNWQASAIKFVVLVPSLLLTIMAVVWSFYGGLPALRSPATYLKVRSMELNRNTFRKGEYPIVYVQMSNEGPQLAKEVRWGASAVLLTTEPFGESVQEATYKDFMKVKQLSAPSDMSPGTQLTQIVTIPRSLSEQDLEDLKEMRMRLMVVGFIQYEDERGHHEIEFCDFFQPPNLWHRCAIHNQHLK